VFWVALAAAYFVLVVSGSVFMFFRQRHLTSIYNVEPGLVEGVLEEVCERYGLAPIRSGNLFVFGLELERHLSGSSQGIQTTPAAAGVDSSGLPGEEFATQNAVLEVEPFRALHHVSLRWDPADSPLRPVIEAELNHRLGIQGAPYHETGAVLTLVGYGVLGLAMLVGFVLLLRMFLAP
jgi:hypothetical protein